MKATGIVRSVDDLVRIVIPKEIKRTSQIRENPYVRPPKSAPLDM